MATDFYMTLPSNASMKSHPDNTLAHYITDLPQRIDLTGEWECGLAETQYPHTLVLPQRERYYGSNPEYEVILWVLQRSDDIDVPCQQRTVQYVDG